MAGRLITLFPQGTVLGDNMLTKTTPPVDTRECRSGYFQLRVDGMISAGGMGTLQVSIQTSNDGINWLTPIAPNQFGPVLFGAGFPVDQFVEVNPLGGFVRLEIVLNEGAPGHFGATLHCYAKLMYNGT